MVQVTPIKEDEAAAFVDEKAQAQAQDAGAEASQDDEYSDVESDSDSDAEFEEDDVDDIANETIADRIVALKDALPPSYRYTLAGVSAKVGSAVQTTASFAGKSLWIITTSSLLLGVPLALSIIGEQQLIEMEREMKMTQSTNEVLAPGAESGFQQPAAGAPGAVAA